MADLNQVELKLVVKEKGLKESITAVSKLERDIIKATKAFNSAKISQDRYNKILLAAKREYQALGVSSQKATAEIRRFAAAQLQAMGNVNNTTSAINKQTAAQMTATKANNRMGVVTQQAGYQVGDFLVQVQSGTNVMVAFGQQATQLVGVLPLVATQLGLTANRAIAIAAGLGIIIPLLTAFGAYWLRSREANEAANDTLKDTDEIIRDLNIAIKSADKELRLLHSTFTKITELVVVDKISELQEELKILETELPKIINKFSEIFNVNGEIAELNAKTVSDTIQARKEEIEILKTTLAKLIAKENLLEIEKSYKELLEEINNIESDTTEKNIELNSSLRERQQLAKAFLAGGEEAVKKEEQLIENTKLVTELLSEKYDFSQAQIGAILKQVKVTQDLEEEVTKVVNQLQLAKEAQELFFENVEKSTEAEKERSEIVDGILQSIEDENNLMQAQIKLNKFTIAFGKDSVAFKTLEKKQAREAYKNELQRNGILGNNLVLLMKAHDLISDQLDDIKDINEEEKELEETTKKIARETRKVSIAVEAIGKAYESALGRLNSFGDSVSERLAKITASNKAIKSGLDGQIAGEIALLKVRRDSLAVEIEANDPEQREAKIKEIDNITKLITATEEQLILGKKLTDSTKAYAKASDDAKREAERLAQELQGPVVGAIGSVSNAFGDFIARGLTDFKGFVDQILFSFTSMIAQMIATAARNKILLSMGFGGAGAAGVTSAFAGPMGSSIGAFGAGAAAGTGFLGGAGAALSGGMGNIFNIGGNAAAAGGTMAATIGAAIVPILAVAAVIGLLTKRTKTLDSGLRVTADGMDTLVESFARTQDSRLFGLLKSKPKTRYSAAGSDVSDPLTGSVAAMQQSAIAAAEVLGYTSAAFEDFSYQFKVSLKGLTEEEAAQKVTEELVKMGDAFAALIPSFTSLNELLATAQQRFDLQTRLYALLGDQEELLLRQRNAERAATHELNQDLLEAIYTLEDAQIAFNKADDALKKANASVEEYTRTLEQSETTLNSLFDSIKRLMKQQMDEANRAIETALSNLRSAMKAQLDEAQGDVATALSNLKSALGRQLSEAEAGVAAAEGALGRAVSARVSTITELFDGILVGLEDKLQVANTTLDASRGVFNLLDAAVRGRSLISETSQFASRQQAKGYISGGGTDLDMLSGALGTLGEPSEKFFSSFTDYARDFADTTNIIKQGRDAAELQLTADEQAVQLLEKQVEDNMAQRDLQIEQTNAILKTEEIILSIGDAQTELLAAQTTYDQALKANEDLQETIITVSDATDELIKAQATLKEVQANHDAAYAKYEDLEVIEQGILEATTSLDEALQHKTEVESFQQALIDKYPVLNTTIETVGSQITAAVNGIAAAQQAVASATASLASAQAAQASAQAAQAAATQDLANAQAAANAAVKADPVIPVVDEVVDEGLKIVETVANTTKAGGFLGLGRTDIASYVVLSDGQKVYSDTGSALNTSEEVAQATARAEEIIANSKKYAKGGYHSGGLRMVGESGPELEATGPSRIYSNKDTISMLSGGNGDLVSEIRGLRSEVSDLKRLQTVNGKYVKRDYDIQRKWDNDGLPATRT